MPKIDKKRIIETIKDYENSFFFITDDPVFDMGLSITIPGNPTADGRVRFIKETGIAFNPQKEALKKLFKPLYDKDKNLQGLILDRVCKVMMTVYYEPTKGFMKQVGYQEIMTETFPSIITKDNDNIEKVHWDILHDWNFKILLDDNLIVFNSTNKVMSFNERIEIEIHFCSDNCNIHPAYDTEIRKSLKYMYAFMNPKFIFKHGLHSDGALFNDYMVTYIDMFRLTSKKSFRDNLKKTLETFPVAFINNILGLLDKKYYLKKMLKADAIDIYTDGIRKAKCECEFNRREALRILEGGLSNDIIQRQRERLTN